MTTPVYRLWNGGLGDHWASLNLLAQVSIARNESVLFSSEERWRERHSQILDALDLGKASLVPRAERGVVGLDGFNVWATEYLPTKERWRRSRILPFICAHFDGVSAAHDKNPPQGEVERIQSWADARGLAVYVLHGDLSLAKVVSLMAQCTLFIGVDSGFSHIAHSVGCPTYILEYRLPIVTCHRHKAYVRCESAGHFTQQADNWLGYVRFVHDASPNAAH